MACAACAKKKPNSYQDLKAIESPPFRATDITVYDLQTDEVRKFDKSDWNTNKINILLFVQDVEHIKEQGVIIEDEDKIVTYVTSEPVHKIKDYYDSGAEKPLHGRIFSSYLLPSRTGLLYNGSTRKAIVYVMKDGDFVVQQMFYHSTFNYKSIRDFLQDYLNGHN